MTYKCPKCNKAFQRQGHLDYHIDNQSCKVLKYFCKHCEKGFTTDTSMYRHMKHTCKTRKEDTNIEKDKDDSIIIAPIMENLCIKKRRKKIAPRNGKHRKDK